MAVTCGAKPPDGQWIAVVVMVRLGDAQFEACFALRRALHLTITKCIAELDVRGPPRGIPLNPSSTGRCLASLAFWRRHIRHAGRDPVWSVRASPVIGLVVLDPLSPHTALMRANTYPANTGARLVVTGALEVRAAGLAVDHVHVLRREDLRRPAPRACRHQRGGTAAGAAGWARCCRPRPSRPAWSARRRSCAARPLW